MTTFFKTAIASACLILAAGSAQAAPYAFSSLTFDTFNLSGLTAPGVTVNSATVQTSDSASYLNTGDAASAGPAAPATTANPLAPLTAGSDVRQVTAGPGPFPTENTFTQALLTAFGARGDALLAGSLVGGNASAGVVAEGNLGQFGTASSAAGTTTGFSVNVGVNSTTTFVLSFFATDSLMATTTASGQGASSQVNASFTVTGTGATAPFSFVYSPDNLNLAVSSTDGQSNTAGTARTSYSTNVTLQPGTYQFSLLSGAQERLNANAQVPEPAPLALLGLGLVGFGLSRLRKNKNA